MITYLFAFGKLKGSSFVSPAHWVGGARAFEEFAQGKHTLKSLGQRLSFWGVVSGNGTPLAKATIQRLLTNITYLGLIEHKGETYEGKFAPIVSRATFEAVQKV